MHVSEIMTKKPYTLKPTDKLKKALFTLVDNDISGCPVVSSGKLSGVITKTDILRIIDVHSKIHKMPEMLSLVLAAVRDERYDTMKGVIKDLMDKPLKEFLSSSAITVDADDDVYSAAKVMNERDIEMLPVTKKKKLVGIVTRTDILKLLEKNEN